MRATEFSFMGALIREHPWFLSLLQEHLDFYDGLLPHLLLADVARWCVAAVAEGSDLSRAQLVPVLAFLEQGMTDGPEVSELVSVSFLENLPQPGEPGGELRDLVGPLCCAQLAIIG
jgi:hypothetical protein